MIKEIKVKIITVIDNLFSMLPIDRNRVLFCSFYGQYNDNPKYISEKLRSMSKKVRIIWVISIKDKIQHFPKYVRIVKYNSISYYYQKNRAHVIIDNGAGIVFKVIKSKNTYPVTNIKKSKQLNISTWHGSPLKKIGMDTPQNVAFGNRFFTSSDVIIAGCDYVKNIFKQAFFNKIPVLLTGTPRNDILFNISEDRKIEIRNKLNLPIEKKIVLYAPTFRTDINRSGIKQIEEMDIAKVLDELSKKFGNEWVMVFRVHQLVLSKIDINVITEKYKGLVFDGNMYSDMAEYLIACDILLTDYSGSLFDFALTGKPCFLFTPDKEVYEKVESGLYIDMDLLPYSYALNSNELIRNILNFNEVEYKEKIRKFLSNLGNIEDGFASYRLSRIILEYIESGKKPNFIN